SEIQQTPTPSARRNQPGRGRKYPPSPRLRRAGQPCLKLRLAGHSKVETKAARPARGATASGEERMPYGVKPGLSGLLGLLGPFGQTRQTKQTRQWFHEPLFRSEERRGGKECTMW